MRQSEIKAPFAPPRSAVVAKAACIVSASVLVGSAVTGCSGPLLTFQPTQAASASEPEKTGSIDRVPTSLGGDLNDEDWRRAQAALGVALDPQGNGRPVRWDNPETTMRGSISPTGLPYVSQDEICRDFLASVIAQTNSRFVRGTGCKGAGGAWHLRKLSKSEPRAPLPALRDDGSSTTL